MVAVRAAFGRDFDHARSAVAVLCRQRAGQQLHALDDVRVERLAEAFDALGNDHAVDAVLHVAVIAADVQLAVRVLHYAGRLQQDLVERRRIAERQAFDRLGVDHVLARADAGRQLVTRTVELGVDLNRLQRGRLVGGVGCGIRHGSGCVGGMGERYGRQGEDDGECEQLLRHCVGRPARLSLL